MDSFRLQSRHGNRNVSVYLPHGYEDGSSEYPVIVLTEDKFWMHNADLPNTLDHLIGKSVRPLIAAFVSGQFREYGGAATRGYVDMIGKDLIPELDRRYRTKKNGKDHAIMGRRAGAVAAVYAALAYPAAFDQCVPISYGRADSVRQYEIAKLIEGLVGRPPRFHFHWNRYDIWRPQSFDVREQSRELAGTLTENEFEVVTMVRLDGAGWKSWSIQAGHALEALFPIE